jgi:hypothetical protein
VAGWGVRDKEWRSNVLINALPGNVPRTTRSSASYIRDKDTLCLDSDRAGESPPSPPQLLRRAP